MYLVEQNENFSIFETLSSSLIASSIGIGATFSPINKQKHFQLKQKHNVRESLKHARMWLEDGLAMFCFCLLFVAFFFCLFYLRQLQSVPWFCHKHREIHLRLIFRGPLGYNVHDKSHWIWMKSEWKPNQTWVNPAFVINQILGTLLVPQVSKANLQEKQEDCVNGIICRNLSSPRDDFTNSLRVGVEDFSLKKCESGWK